MADTEENKVIRCMFISKLSEKSPTYDIGIISNSFEFFHFELRISDANVTELLQKKMRAILSDF